MRKITTKRVGKQKVRRPVQKRRIKPSTCKFQSVPSEPLPKLPMWLARLDNEGDVNRVQVVALRRQCKAEGRMSMIKVWLVKDKDRNGRWIIRLKGGITGREYIRADRSAGDCFFRLRLYGWTVHEGKLSEDPRDDYLWIPGREIADALQDFGWM